MTAEIAVMNKLGVALAADSAVTADTSNRTKKIYSSADKLFQLSNHAPVAIMTSGYADFLDLPWETIIKAYRKKLGAKTFKKLSDYSSDFFSFLETNKKIFTRDMRDKNVYLLIRDIFDDVLIATKDQCGKVDEKNLHKIILMELKEVIDRENKRVPGLTSAKLDALRERYKKELVKNRNIVFKKYVLPLKTKSALDMLVAETLSRTGYYIHDTTVVFAGFGEDDYVPACLEYRVGGMVLDKLRYRLRDETQMTELVGAILSFGQTEVADTFMNGISPKINRCMWEENWKFVEKVKNIYKKVNEELTVRQEKKIDSDILKEWENTQLEVKEQLAELWPRPLDIVENLPKTELAEMAETLINLTKFHMRMSEESETVGGSIDVALITKGDGFVWVKRKNYYPPELNKSEDN